MDKVLRLTYSKNLIRRKCKMKKKLIFVLACVMCFAVSLGVIACNGGKNTEKTYAITYDPGFGAQTFDGEKVKLGEKFTLAAAPTRDGYDFLGWNDGKGTYAAGSEYTLAEEKDVTFTGQWQLHADVPKTVTATFLDEDGEIFSSEEVKMGGNAVGPGNTLVHKYNWCYEQTGWDNSLIGLTQDTTFKPVFAYHPTSIEAYIYEDNEDGSGYILSLQEYFDATKINSGKIALPDSYEGKPVTELKSVNGLTANIVYVPGSIKKVDDESFVGAPIKEIIFDEGVEEIGDMALYNAGVSTEVEVKWSDWPEYQNIVDKVSFPSTLNKVGCYISPYITSIEIAEGANLTMSNGLLMTDNNTKIVSVPYTGEDISIVIPATVSEIPDNMCDGRNDIVSLRISGKLTRIGSQAFNGDLRLNEITFDDGAYVEELGQQAFYMCGTKYGTTLDASWTKPLVFPTGLKKIGMGALWQADLCELSIPNTVEEIGEAAIENSRYCELKLTMTGGATTVNGKYTLQNGVLIEKGSGDEGDKIMLYANGNLATDYTTPTSVKRFDSFAFAYQTHLKNLTVSEGVKVIPQAFADGCSGNNTLEMSLKKVVLPASLEKIEDQFPEMDGVFAGAHGFGGVVLNGQYGAFIEQGNLTELIIDENAKITYLPSTIAANSSVISFRIPKYVESIGVALFGRALQKYEVADGNTHLKAAADGVLFNADMTEILAFPAGYTKTTWKAPASLKKISADGMYYTLNLEEIDFSESQLEEIGAYAFEQNYFVERDENRRPIQGTEKGLKKITFPATLKKVDDCIFSGDYLLSEVIFMGTNPPEFFLNASYQFAELFPNNQSLEIKVPEGCANAYYAALYSIDPNYALLIKETKEITFEFELNGGKYNGADFIWDITDAILNDYPAPTKDGEFFLGWYTRSGENGDWGELVLPPYAPIVKDNESTVTLYAKYGDARWETGAWYAPYKYEENKTYTGRLCGRNPNYVQDENILPILWIEYTPTKDMPLGWDEGSYYLSYETGKENNFNGAAIFESTRFNDYWSDQVYYLKADTTYYIAIFLCDTTGNYLGGTECTVSNLQFIKC